MSGIAAAMLTTLVVVLSSGGFFDTTPSVTTGTGPWAPMSISAAHA